MVEVCQTLNGITIEEIASFCNRHLVKTNDEKIEVINFEYKNVSDTPKGFLGGHRFLNVSINRKIFLSPSSLLKHNNYKVEQEKLHFFVKYLPDNVQSQMEYLEEFGVFEKEKNVCKYLLPRLFEINNNNYFAPKCYLAKDKAIIFENLAEQGYCLGTNFDGTLDYNHLLCALKYLSKMHSSSILLEIKTKNKISSMYKNCIIENSYPLENTKPRNIYVKKTIDVLSELLKQIPKYKTLSNLNEITKLFQIQCMKIFEFCKTSSKFRNVFCHGDLWANNVMFKYSDSRNHKEEQQIPIECRFVDFQLTRYAPPVLDVMTLLTIPTTSEFRRKNLNSLLEAYYKFMKIDLLQHNIAIENILPQEEFKESVEYFKLPGLIESCLFSHMTCLPEDIVISFLQNSDNFYEFFKKSRQDICLKAFANNDLYRERMTDMITDLVDKYVLNQNNKI